MKKIYFMVASLFMGVTSFAQSNLGFETFTSGHPSNWGLYTAEAMNINTLVATSGGTATATPVTQSTPAAEGSSAAKLTSFTLSGATNTSHNGDYAGHLSQLFPILTKINSVSYQFKSTIGATDSAMVFVEVYNNNGSLPDNTNIIGQGRSFIKGNNTQWTSGTVTVNYFNADAPQSARIVIVSSGGDIFQSLAPVVPGSILEIDDITIQYSTTAPAGNVTNVVATDIANNDNGSDLQVTFDIPATETADVDKYYAAVFAPGLTPGMLTTPGDFFENAGIEITPNGSSQTITFDATEVYYYVSGSSLAFAPIENDIPLVVWIYVKAKAGKEDVYKASNQITLTSPLSVAGFIKEDVKVFPNPATDVLNVEFGTEAVVGVNIIDLNGQVISNNTISNGTAKVNVSNLQSGMYIFQGFDVNGNVLKTDKFIKK